MTPDPRPSRPSGPSDDGPSGSSDGRRRARGTVLVVDDEAYVRESLETLLGRRGFTVRSAASAGAALDDENLDGADLVLSDLKMPGMGGDDLLRTLAERAPELPVVLMTGHGTVRSAVECLRAGAEDYLLKPVDPDELVLVLERVLESSGRRRELAFLRDAVGAAAEAPGGDGSVPRPLGDSAAWREVLETAEVAAPTDTSVLLLGESGTGKEEVARYIHRLGHRRDGPFVPVNCAAIPPELFESEFFGHRRGAFTGAIEDRVGRFRVAHRGTLLMDEIDSLPARAQAKVLRVLQDGQFERVGDSRPTSADVRLLSASNTDLTAAVETGRFRADLYYRIQVLTIHLPPLRERREDVEILARAFLSELAARIGKRVTRIAPSALALLASYDWPGNVRELKNVVERGVVLTRGAVLEPDALPAELRRDRPADGSLELRSSLLAEEKRLLEEALARSGGVRREAARLLGIDERNLPYYLKKHDLAGHGKGRGDGGANEDENENEDEDGNEGEAQTRE